MKFDQYLNTMVREGLVGRGFADLLLQRMGAQASEIYGRTNSRLRTTAGRCMYLGGEPVGIQISRKTVRGSSRRLEEVLAHEVAHAIAGWDEDHGPTWKRICEELGGTGDRFHQFADHKRPVPVPVAECLGCGVKFHRRRALPTANRIHRHTNCPAPQRAADQTSMLYTYTKQAIALHRAQAQREELQS